MSTGRPNKASGEDRGRDITSAPALTPAWDSPLRRFGPWVATAFLALTATWLTFQNLSLRTANDNLLTERRLAEVACRMAQNQLAERTLLTETMINDLDARLRRSGDLTRLKVSTLAPPTTGRTEETQAIVVWDPDQQTGLLTLDHLPALTDGRDYQIWVTDPACPDPVNGGVFHGAPDGRAALAFKPDQPVKQAAVITISLERKGGAPKAGGPIVLVGKLSGR